MAIRKLRGLLAGLVVSAMTSVLAGHGTEAATPPGTRIENQAQGRYFDPLGNVAVNILSNVATTRVIGVHLGRLEPALARPTGPDEEVILSHILSNQGNLPTSYALGLSNLAGDSFDVRNLVLVLDMNMNGRPDPGDRVIDGPILLEAGFSAQILVTGRTPGVVTSGDVAHLDVRADIVNPIPSATVRSIDSVQDELLVEFPPRVRLSKALTLPCVQMLSPGEQLEVRVSAGYAGRLAPQARDIAVGAETLRGALIEDRIAPPALPVAGSAPYVAPASGVALLAFGEGLSTRWIRYADWDGTTRPTRIALFVPENMLRDEQDIQLRYRLQAMVPASAGALSPGVAFADYQGDGSPEADSLPPCAATPDPVCFAGAQSAFMRLETLQAHAAMPELALSQAQSSFTFFAPSPTAGATTSASQAMVLAYVPSLALQAPARMTARIADVSTGDALTALMEPVPGAPGYFSLEESARLQLASASRPAAECSSASPTSCALQSARQSVLSATIGAEGCADTLGASGVAGGDGRVFDSMLTGWPVVPDVAVLLHPVTFSGASGMAPPRGAALTTRSSAAPIVGASIARMPTDADGVYTLPEGLAAGDYCVTVDAPGYVFPATNRTEDFSPDYSVDALLPGGCLQNGVFTVGAMGLTRVAAGGAAALGGLDIPIHHMIDLAGLTVVKTPSTDAVDMGDFVRYELKITNNSDNRTVSNVVLRDAAARGLAYAPGSLRLDGAVLPDSAWTLESPNVNAIAIGALTPKQKRTLTYVMRVGAGAFSAKSLTNVAAATGVDPFGTAVGSPDATATVDIKHEGVFRDEGLLIGRVTVASVCESLPKEMGEAAIGDDATAQRLRLKKADGTEGKPYVWPLSGARVWLETGVYAVTDERGYYSLYGVEDGPHVARLDGETVPPGLTPAVLGQPNAGEGWSQFVNMRRGDLMRADFHMPVDCDQAKRIWKDLKPRVEQRRIERSLDDAARLESRVSDPESDIRGKIRGDGDLSTGVAGDLRPETSAVERRALVSTSAEEQKPYQRAAFGKTEDVAKTITAEMAKDGRWLWPQTDVSRDGRFVLVARAGVTPVLYVNGEAVPDTQIGERFENNAARAQIVSWYGVALKAGLNTLEAKGKDSFGNERVLASRQVRRAGAPVRLVIVPDRTEIRADGGASAIDMAVRLVDEADTPVEGVSFITMEATDGLWLLRDLDDKKKGLQLRLDDGEAHIRLASSTAPGVVKVTAESEDKRKADIEVRFIANDRPLIAVGLVSLQGVWGEAASLPTNIEPIVDGDAFDKSYELGARGAVFLKGKIRGDALMTLSFDSSRASNDKLFRDLDPNAYYPIYGDGSTRGYEGLARSPLYVRVEKKGYSGMWGDYATDAESSLKLGGVRRSLTGVNLRADQQDWTAQVFAARPETSHKTIEMEGKGLAMGYVLPDAPIKRGTERLAIVTRDRLNPGIAMTRREVARGADYVIDYETGRLDFFSPIPTLDRDLNPVYIAADYDTEEASGAYTVAGVRAEKRFGENARVGAAFTHIDDPTNPNQIGAIYGEVKDAKGDWRVRVEGAYSRDPDSGESGKAVLVEGEAKVTDKIKVEGGVGLADKGFQGEGAAVSSGRLEARASVSAENATLGNMRAQGVYSADLGSDDWRASADATLERSFGPVKGRAGVRYETAETAGVTTSQTFATVGVSGSTTIQGRSVTGSVDVEKALNTEALRVKGKIDAQISPDTRAYISHEFSNEAAGRTGPEGDAYLSLGEAVTNGRTAIGLEGKWLKDTTVYTETRLTGAGDSTSTQTAVGLRGEYAVREGLKAQVQAENVTTFGSDSGDSTSVSIGLRDDRNKALSSSGRIEGRVENDGYSVGVSGALVGRATDELSLFSAARYDGKFPNVGFSTHQAHLKLGAAFRPRNNRYHWLLQYEAKYDSPDGDGDFTHVLSAHLNTQLTERLQFSGRIAGKMKKFIFDDFEASADAELIDGRVLYSVTDRVDLEARAGLLATNWGESLVWSAGVGVNVDVTKNVELGAGYNFEGFTDKDLDPQAANRQGAYVRLNVKFDEGLFDWLSAK